MEKKNKETGVRVFEKQSYRDVKKILGNGDGLLTKNQLRDLAEYDKLAVVTGLKWTTRSNRLKILKEFGSFLKKDFKKATKQDFIDFISYKASHPKGKGKFTHNYKALMLATIRKFYKWLYDIEEGYPDVVRNGVFTKENLKTKIDADRPDYTEEEILKVLEGTRNYRDKLLVVLLAEAGLRISEMQSLKLKDIELTQQYAKLKVPADTKTGYRAVFIVKSVPELIRYLDNHKARHDPEAPLFCNVVGNEVKHLSYGTLYAALTSAFERAGVKKKGGFHTFRRTAVRNDLKHGQMSDQILKSKYGWQYNSAMLKVYSKVKEEDLKSATLEANGVIDKEAPQRESKLAPKICPRCGTLNPVGARVCVNCFSALNLEVAHEIEDRREMLDEMLIPIMKVLEDKEVKEYLAKRIENLPNVRNLSLSPGRR